MNVATPSVTFDQRLWLKAYEIAKLKQLDLIIQLGDFHTLMSFLESIGAVMRDQDWINYLNLFTQAILSHISCPLKQ